MTTRIQILDGTTPLLAEIVKLSYGMALESLSVAGAKVQKEARNSLRSKSHNWFQQISNGKRRIYTDGATNRELGLRMSHSDGSLANPSSMSNFITSYLMEKSLTVVVGGRHSAFSPKKREGGKVTGTLNRVNGVSKASHGIIHKLNFGERNSEHSWDGKDSMARFKGANYVARGFMEEGLSASRSGVIDAMTKRYGKLLHRAVDRANVKIITRGSLVS